MAKVMLVEDDNNLREIYEARLLAEGYEIISAQDGEEALALAVKERPDLIIADIMMPKISGFDMLDILRSTPETKDTKVVMMTALSQAEDKERANKLGADRYLVKSQVTLEDVAKVAHEVLEGKNNQAPTDTSPTGNPQGGSSTADTSSAQSTPASPIPIADTSGPQAVPTDQPIATTVTTPTTMDTSKPITPTNEIETAEKQIQDFINNKPVTVADVPATPPVVTDTPPAVQPATQTPAVKTDTNANNDGVLAAAMAKVNGSSQPNTDSVVSANKHSVAAADNNNSSGTSDLQSQTSVHTKTINPINDLNKQSFNFQELIAKEEANEADAQAKNDAGKATVAEVSGKPDKQDDLPTTTIVPTQPPESNVANDHTDPNSIAL